MLNWNVEQHRSNSSSSSNYYYYYIIKWIPFNRTCVFETLLNTRVTSMFLQCSIDISVQSKKSEKVQIPEKYNIKYSTKVFLLHYFPTLTFSISVGLPDSTLALTRVRGPGRNSSTPPSGCFSLCDLVGDWTREPLVEKKSQKNSKTKQPKKCIPSSPLPLWRCCRCCLVCPGL